MKNVLVIGGAGFIGSNLAKERIQKKDKVTVLDDLSRVGTPENAKWLKKNYSKVKIVKADISRDIKKLETEVKKADVIYHMAAQVAVTTSVKNPRRDFEINALGSFNILEAVRKSKKNPFILYASTNKVYGGLEEEKVVEKKTRYEFKNLKKGVSEKIPLDFHSPYGCSKGAADQYFRDYSRIYGLNSVVLRQSCIYGNRQFGVEDQGWIAWFIIAGILGKKITIYGNGKQVRDVLYIQDLLDAFKAAEKRKKQCNGKIYNIGGGAKNTLSLLEFMQLLEKNEGIKLNYSFGTGRPGDQPIYISDISKAKKELKWVPKFSPKKGIHELTNWIKNNEKLFKKYVK